ncbi:MAG: hypothetical protein IJ165_11350 [Proteobacteria bacterium]|nr:hypothetical protein [Pseudomonadota bacterium]
MSNIRVLFAAVLIFCLTGFVACKKKEEAPAPAPAAEATADAAKADDAKAEEAKAEEAKADAKADDGKVTESDINTVAKFFTDIIDISNNAGDDCDKLGTGLTDHLTKNSESLVASMKKIAKLEEDAPEAKKLGEAMDKVMGDNTDFSKKMDTCKDNPKVVAFSMGLLGVIMQAAPEAADAADAADDAPAADAAAPAAE